MTSPSETPHLSYSTAKILITQSPAHAWLNHRMLGGQRDEPTDEQIKGTALHSMLLGKDGGSEIQIIPFDDYRTNAAKAAKAECLAAGRTPIKLRTYEKLVTAADEIRANLQSQGINLDGESEVPVTWQEATTRGPVTCRGKLDHKRGRRQIIDLKSTSNAHPDFCSRQAVNLGYDIQWAAYCSALQTLDPEIAGRVDFIFAFFETEPPYSVTPLRPDGMFREHGERRWKKAVEIWAECLASNCWPHYVDGVGSISVPPWALAKMEGDYEAELGQ